MANGSLSLSLFQNFLIEDVEYLRIYQSTLVQIAENCENGGVKKLLHAIANDTIELEKAINSHFLQQHFSETANAELHSAFTSYRRFISDLATKPHTIAIAGITPCLALYAAIGRQLHHSCDISESHPYYDWLITYCDKSFQQSASDLLAYYNQIIDNQNQDQKSLCLNSFKSALKYELKIIISSA